MESLVPAFLAALLTQIVDKPAWLTAVLADRYRRPLTVLAAAALAHLAGNLVAAWCGGLVSAMLTPNAAALFLAVALAFAGASGLWAGAFPARLDGWRLGPFFTPLLGVLILAFGERTQFVTLALAGRGGFWAFPAIGAALGASVVAGAAVFLGERQWRALPLRAVRLGTGMLLLAVGAWMALAAARLL